MNNYRMVATAPNGEVVDIAEGSAYHVMGFAAEKTGYAARHDQSITLTLTRIDDGYADE